MSTITVPPQTIAPTAPAAPGTAPIKINGHGSITPTMSAVTSMPTISHMPTIPSVLANPNTTRSEKIATLENIIAKIPPSAWTQLPTTVTLDSVSLTSVCALLIVLIHFGNLTLIKLLIAAVPPVLFVYNDYLNFLRLGPGGTPSTPSGYLRLKWLGLFVLKDPFAAPTAPVGLEPKSGLFARRKTKLPYRVGPRPTIAGLAPQRQTDQIGSDSHYRTLGRLLTSLPGRMPDTFSAAKSTLEKYGLALYARNPVFKGTHGEICHVHDSDHSLHLSLHPDDAREVFEKQWGERHPLGVVSRFSKMPVTPYFNMIYAPQNDEQFKIVCMIIEAAVWFVSMEDVTLGASTRG